LEPWARVADCGEDAGSDADGAVGDGDVVAAAWARVADGGEDAGSAADGAAGNGDVVAAASGCAFLNAIAAMFLISIAASWVSPPAKDSNAIAQALRVAASMCRILDVAVPGPAVASIATL